MGSSGVSVLSLLLVLGTSTVLADVIPISITRQVAANGFVERDAALVQRLRCRDAG